LRRTEILKNNKYNLRLILISAICFFLAATAPLYSLSPWQSTHFDKSKLPRGCGSCHRGHGVFNTPMLPESIDVFCFRCHGNNTNTTDARSKGALSKHIIAPDIQKAFNKPYRHPVEKTVITGFTRNIESYPATNRSAPRHAQCTDCHNPHRATKENTLAGIKGVNAHGLAVNEIGSEYELCFKCHSNSANLPPDEKNKADQFKISNPSYHPVIAQGKNIDVPSLIFPLTASSIIKCTDCHNNDDTFGPKGPHGSSYRYILKKNFTERDGPEGPFQYELCYSCHRRESILGNESFFYHDLHISVVGASCRTCHNPHGSSQYPHLIDFDNMSVTPSSKGFIEYRQLGRKAGECYLICHGKDHSPLSYPVQMQ
jgi:predicted CXXCH cytochrome family protein